jgi:hypothetical protein
MNLRILILSMSLLHTIAGCGAPELPYNDNSKDPELFAKAIKQVVVESVADARKSREPFDQIRLISNSITGKGQPVGSYGPIYERLKAAAEQLADACEQADGPVPDMAKKLEELLAIANELPGDATAVEEPRI